uniref:Uncharacterized protein n=1 Tax=Solibacter usitatus (strain Ellin6076) TaxID=234267 RepID=Q023A3_SOLUE
MPIRKFGNSVTYTDDHISHSKTEFAFDVFQASRGRYASEGYKDFVGFQVSKRVLQQAFLDTHGMKLEHVFLKRRPGDRVVPSPGGTHTSLAHQSRVANQRAGDSQGTSGSHPQGIFYNLSRSSFEKTWGSTYQRPGFGSRVLATLFRIVPRIGPFKALAFEPLTAETEKLYMAGFNASIDRHRELLGSVGAGRLNLPNDNFDVGDATKAGSYRLTDAAYAKLLHQLDGHYPELPKELRTNILAFYQDLGLPISTKKDESDWLRLQDELDRLRTINQSTTSGASPASRRRAARQVKGDLLCPSESMSLVI